jgi:hypothetical protein
MLGLQGLVKMLPHPVPLGLIGIVEQIIDQILHCRQMIVTGTPPGYIIEQFVDLFGDTPAFRERQSALGDDIIDKVHALCDRTLAYRHE